ncbi:MAG: hypothetical protein N2645_09635 [Clostridia bacterium]|nr:hypothetical protein [Clostridia bacterium]
MENTQDTFNQFKFLFGFLTGLSIVSFLAIIFYYSNKIRNGKGVIK